MDGLYLASVVVNVLMLRKPVSLEPNVRANFSKDLFVIDSKDIINVKMFLPLFWSDFAPHSFVK